MDQLSAEDSLRLNVLLASQPQAIRVDESSMTVFGLSPHGEAQVRLNPNHRHDVYLRWVRELLSGHVLGSPGGYPVYLRRWTRMGQARYDSLAQLLLLGEPEAVVAVVHSPALTDELARRAWWAMPTSENARQMLERDAVVRGAMGPELAAYLVEYLPFEEEALDQIHSVRLLLQPGLVSEEVRRALWEKGKHRNAYHVGFLLATPDALPEAEPAREDLDDVSRHLTPLAETGNPFARQMLRVAGTAGQSFLSAAARVLSKPGNQDVVNLLLGAVAHYFRTVRPAVGQEGDLTCLLTDADRLCAGEGLPDCPCPPELAAFLEAGGAWRAELRAMLVLSRLGYPVVRPVFSRTTAIGSLMRRKLAPVTDPLLQELAVLRGR